LRPLQIQGEDSNGVCRQLPDGVNVSEKQDGKTFGKSLVAGVLAILSTVYLLNPGAGIIDIIPDNIPIFGNLDEAAATAILLGCLSYFGLDLKRLFGGAPKTTAQGEKPVPGKVVEED
jgi:hypothetical protein